MSILWSLFGLALALAGAYGFATKRDHPIEYVWCVAAFGVGTFVFVTFVLRGRGF